MRDVGIELPEKGFRSGVHALQGASFAQAVTESDVS